MAFRDENGRITIDEVAARQDIKNLEKARECLVTAIEHLKEITVLASDFSGKTGTVISESAMQIQKQIQGTVECIDTTSYNIDLVIKNYQAADASLKKTFNGIDM